MSISLASLEAQIWTLLGDDPDSPALFSQDEVDTIIDKVVLAYSAAVPCKRMNYLSTFREVHRIADPNLESLPDATDETSLYALLIHLKSLINAHFAAATYHRTGDTANIIEADDATDEATAITLAVETKADLNAHLTQSRIHMVDDAANRVTIEDCVDLATCYVLTNQIKQRFNTHLSYETDGRWLCIKAILDAAADEPALADSYTITASVTGGEYGGGTIDPVGAVEVTARESQLFTMTPGEYSYVSSVLVDDVETLESPGDPGVAATYTFTNVVADHTIVVTFTSPG